MKQRKEEILARRMNQYKQSREAVVKSALKEREGNCDKTKTPATKSIRFKFVRTTINTPQ